MDFSLEKLQHDLAQLGQESCKTEDERRQLLRALAAAHARIETPVEAAIRLNMLPPLLAGSLTVCNDVDLFRKWIREKQGQPATVDDLANLVGVDPVLLERLLRYLVRDHVLELVSPGTFALTKFAEALAERPIRSTISWRNHIADPAFINLPTFLREEKYMNPSTMTPTNWTHMRGRAFFDDMETRPAVFEALHDVMNMAAAQKTPWPEICPPESVISRMKPQVPLLVDVGGGTGVDIEQFRQRLPADARYELILQDLPSVLEGRKVGNGIVPMGHDFFTDQPVKGATAYYLHTVLHDWPDDFAVKILEQLAKAVEPGYSSLLIHEVVVDETPSDWDPMVDLYMLSQHNSRERKEKAWADLLGRAGFVIVKVWRKTGSIESVIEAQRPAE